MGWIRQRMAEYGSFAKQKKHLRWMLEKTRPFMRRLALLLLFDGSLTLLSIGCTLLNKRLIDSAVVSSTLDVAGFAILVALTVASIGAGALSTFMTTLIHEQYAFGIRADVYRRTLAGPWNKITAFHTGDLTTRLNNDINEVANGIADIIPTGFYLIVRLILSFCVLYQYEPMLALTILIVGPAGVLTSVIFGGKLRDYQKALMDNESAYRGFIQESAANITSVKAFEWEGRCADTLDSLRDSRFTVLRKRSLTSMYIRLGTNGLFSFGYVLAFGWGVYRLFHGDITYGTMSVFLALASQIQGSLLSLPQLIPKGANVLASAGRVMELDAMEQEPREETQRLKGAVGIRMENVSFAYKGDPVLRSLSLDMEPGTRVGLVGESGAGKTTIARLMLGLVTADEGEALLYDTNGGRQPLGAGTRTYFSYVAQGNTLLSGTVRDNLLMGNPDATEAEMNAALTTAEAAFVLDLPKGLDTVLTERGGTVSEGQAQRIAIARALLRHRPILILDEATSALDFNTEQAVIHNLRHTTLGMTCVVISHRAPLLDLCDQCIHLEDGRAVEERTPAASVL